MADFRIAEILASPVLARGIAA